MSFEGAIEAFGRETISGWASYVIDGQHRPVQVVLRLRTRGTLSPTTILDRDGRTGFIYRLPPELHAMTWSDFLDDFEAVTARCSEHPEAREWRVPLFKSVLSPLNPDNRTTLLASRLREYQFEPKPGGSIAAFTIAYNEHLVLPIWARYYTAHFGAENLFVIDQGSDKPYEDLLPEGVNIVRLPRDMFDNWLIARIVAVFQRFLLESYESVLYTDSDEFVCATPEALAGHSLSEFLRALPRPVGITTGYDLIHDTATEKPFDPSRPLLSQRRFMHRQTMMDKPLISRIPLNWVPGFHNAAEGGERIQGLYMLHLRWFDLDHALVKGGFYRASQWSQFDVQHKLADYQRQGADEILARFRSFSEIGARLRDATFDPDQPNTVVPDWMSRAITI
jgi:hypothetical protein